MKTNKTEVDYGYGQIVKNEIYSSFAVPETMKQLKSMRAFARLTRLMKEHNEKSDLYGFPIIINNNIYSRVGFKYITSLGMEAIKLVDIYFNSDKIESIYSANKQLFNDYLGIE